MATDVLLKFMVGGVSIVTVILMTILVINIYRNDRAKIPD